MNTCMGNYGVYVIELLVGFIIVKGLLPLLFRLAVVDVIYHFGTFLLLNAYQRFLPVLVYKTCYLTIIKWVSYISIFSSVVSIVISNINFLIVFDIGVWWYVYLMGWGGDTVKIDWVICNLLKEKVYALVKRWSIRSGKRNIVL